MKCCIKAHDKHTYKFCIKDHFTCHKLQRWWWYEILKLSSDMFTTESVSMEIIQRNWLLNSTIINLEFLLASSHRLNIWRKDGIISYITTQKTNPDIFTTMGTSNMIWYTQLWFTLIITHTWNRSNQHSAALLFLKHFWLLFPEMMLKWWQLRK